MLVTFGAPFRALAIAATLASACQARLVVRRAYTDLSSTHGLSARGQHDSSMPTDQFVGASDTYGSQTGLLSKLNHLNFLDQVCANPYVGYFFIFFKDDTEQINAGISKGNDPVDYDFYNGGGPILTSGVGTKHTRDPSLVRGSQKNYIIATDNSLKAINSNFTYAARYSSRKITVYESDGPTLAKWKPARVTDDLVGTWSGGVSAPEAIWDCSCEKYMVLFSTNSFAQDDPDHLKTPGNTSIYYSYTTDFVTFSEAKQYYIVPNGGLSDMTVANVADNTYVRFFRDDTNGILKVRGQVSHDGLFGDWQDIGSDKEYVSDDGANGGPLLFRDNQDKSLWHVWVDEFQGGYKPYETKDVTKPGYTLSNAPNFPKDLKQGSVTPVTDKEYAELKAAQFTVSS